MCLFFFHRAQKSVFKSREFRMGQFILCISRVPESSVAASSEFSGSVNKKWRVLTPVERDHQGTSSLQRVDRMGNYRVTLSNSHAAQKPGEILQNVDGKKFPNVLSSINFIKHLNLERKKTVWNLSKKSKLMLALPALQMKRTIYTLSFVHRKILVKKRANLRK